MVTLPRKYLGDDTPLIGHFQIRNRGTVGGSLIIRWLKDELGPDRLVAAGSLAAAFALVLFGLAHDPITAISACLLGGGSWTVVLTKLYVSAQVALPDWARGRGLAGLAQVRTIGETVSVAMRERVRAVLGVPIADTYSSQELGTIAIDSRVAV